MAALLTEVPTEVIQRIAFFLSQVDLLNLSLTCKELQRQAEPSLYQEYVQPHRSPLSLFVDKLIARPDIAEKHVKRVRLGSWIAEDDMSRPGTLSEESYNIYTRVAKTARVIDAIVPYESAAGDPNTATVTNWREQDWYRELLQKRPNPGPRPYELLFCENLRAGYEDALVALMLALLPNLRILELHSIPMDSYESLLPWHLPPHGFSKLVRLTATNDDDEPWPASFLTHVIDCTSLQTLEIARGSSWYFVPGDFAEAPPFSLSTGLGMLTALHLPNCAFTRAEMQKLLLASPRLKRLYYSHGLEKGPNDFTASELIAMLDPFKHALEDLYLDLLPQEEEDEGSDHLIDSLKHFTALKRLDTNVDVWRMLAFEAVLGKYQYGPSDEEEYSPVCPEQDRWCLRLPPCLEILSLHSTERDTVPDGHQLKDLVLSQKQVLPALQALFITILDEGFRGLISMALDGTIDDDQSDMENTLLIKIGTALEIPGPIRTTFHGWRPDSEKPRIRWVGHKYELELCKWTRPANDTRPPFLNPWLRDLIGDSTQFQEDDGSELSDMSDMSEEVDYGHGYMMDDEWDELVESL